MQIIACEYKWNTVNLSGSMEKTLLQNRTHYSFIIKGSEELCVEEYPQII